MTPKEAINVILSDRAKYGTTLSYAVDYCLEAMLMDQDSYDFSVQCLYILNNITHWRHPKAKEVRVVLKKAGSFLAIGHHRLTGGDYDR